MTLGTAGFNSLMSAFAIKAREEILLGEKVNNVLVTGSTGGVGSVAVIALNKMGYNVTAVTGKDSKADNPRGSHPRTCAATQLRSQLCFPASHRPLIVPAAGVLL